MLDDDDIGEDDIGKVRRFADPFWPLFTAPAIMLLVVGLVTAASIVVVILLTP
jgi:hypothetical protein